jgi:hypothetical protein
VLSNAGTRGSNCSGLGLIVLNQAERKWGQGTEPGWTGWRESNLDMAGGRGVGSNGPEATEECIPGSGSGRCPVKPHFAAGPAMPPSICRCNVF